MPTASIPPLSLYIHIPWCERKCPYCDFNSHRIDGSIPEEDYIDSLITDMINSQKDTQGRALSSIFFGGGTPSLFSAAGIARILDEVSRYFQVSPACEVTLEANPGSAEQAKFRDFYDCGVNRLSIGIQSFNDDHLQRLGRIHNSYQARQAVLAAQRAGFDNINLDLMYGLPGQTWPQASADIQQAVALKPQHLSWYELTIEPNTTFYSQPPELPADADMDEIASQGLLKLQSSGYDRYEISAFAASDSSGQPLVSQHNMNYWNYGDYIGLGAGAHSKVSQYQDASGLQVRRYQKRRQPQGYLTDCGAVQISPVTVEERMTDYLLNALRLIQGFSKSQCQKHTGLSARQVEPVLAGLEQQGFVACRGDSLIPTPKGISFQNEALLETMGVLAIDRGSLATRLSKPNSTA